VAGTITTIVRALFQSQGADKVVSDINKVGKAGEESAKKQTRLGNESTNTGRAFSSQASGLGGLVAAYAGAAATTFALQQAFAALKSAADFQQIISGTNALAASFGQSGSQILNSIQDITKGQLSLKEASAAANLALAAGFNPKQINSLSEVATKASRTLGRDLTDSYNRLVRGAAKLEPELLDELGIFTRIEPAIEAYASKTGKAASSLTNFERRQAFVNAIIDEGSRKYSEISLSTDTSSEALNRLAARIVDVGNKLGSILTDFLAPIANFFGKDLGNSVLIFLGILTLALGKGRTLLEAFFTDLSTRALETGARVSSALTGPAFTTNIEKAGEALKGIGVGLTKAEAATIRSIKEGTVQPQQIQARIDELKALQERQQSRQFEKGLQGKALDQSISKANAATIAIRELEEAQKKASNSSVIAGSTFEKLGGGLSRLATGISSALGYFNLFLAALGAAQLIGQVFGVDLLGSITNFFVKLQEQAKATREAISSLVTEASKDSLSVFKFRFKKEDIEAAGEQVATTLQDILRFPIANTTLEARLQRALSAAEGERLFTFKESSKAQLEVRIRLLKDLAAIKPSAELVKILTLAPEAVGGQALDYVKLFTSGELEKGALKFANVITNILDTNKEIDKYTGKTALNVGLGIVEVQKFYEEQAKGLLTAESASQRNIALTERIKQIDTEIIEARIRGAEETTLRVREAIGIEALRLNIQKDGLITKQREINLISEELAQRERIRKSIQTTFSSQIKFIENLPTPGLFNPDKTISRSQEETQRNQVLFLGQQASSLEKSLKLQIDSLNVATKTKKDVEDTLINKSKQVLIDGANQDNLEEIARIQAALTKATQAENIETSKLTDINVRLKEVLQAQLGIMYEAGKQAYQLAIQEEKRTLEYQKQLDSLKNQGEQLEIQNKINRAQAAAEANQRRGQSQIKLLESEINYLKEIENLVESVSKAQLADLEIRKNQVDRAQQLRDADRELAKARTERQFTGALAVPTLQKEILGRSQNLVLEEDLIRLDKQIADINYARELALIEDRKAIADQEFSVTKERLKVQEEEIQTQLATLEGRKVLQNQQQVIEDNIIKKREKLDRDKIQNEISVLALQSDLARARARGELDVAADAKLRRDFELDLISKQLFLLEQQKEVFKQFLNKYEELINKQLGTTASTTANDIFKNFETDLTKARATLTANRQLSEQIYNQENRNILLRAAGEIDVNNIRAAGARAELDNLIKTQEQEAQTRDQIRMAQELNRETEVKLLQDKLKGLETEAALAKKRYDTAIVSAATDEIKAAQVYASELQRIADQRNKVKQLFEDISRGIKENLSTAVLDFFKAINQGIPTIQAFREGMQKLAISVAETIQTAILKKFLIEPLQNLVGGAIGSLYTAITGDQLAKTGDQILQSVFTGNALRVTMVGAGGTTSGGATPDQASGPVTPGVIKPPTEEAQGFGDKLKELGVNFQTVGTVAATTFAATLAATRDWKKAFIYTVVSALGTALTQIATKQLFSGAAGAGGAGLFSGIGNLFSGLNATPTGVGNIAPGAIGTGTAIGGPVKHMAAGGYAGLRDRVPALLEPGEFVIRRPAAMAIGGQTLNQMNATGQTAPGNVMVNVNNQGTSQEVVGTPKVSVNGRDMIVDIVVRDIQNNGPIRKTLRGM
jgi:hypothetical protein